MDRFNNYFEILSWIKHCISLIYWLNIDKKEENCKLLVFFIMFV